MGIKSKKTKLKLISATIALVTAVGFSFAYAQEEAPQNSGQVPATENTDPSSEPAAPSQEQPAEPAANEGITENSAPHEPENIENAVQKEEQKDRTETEIDYKFNQEAPTLPERTEKMSEEDTSAGNEHDIVTSFIRTINIKNLSIIAHWQMSARKENGQYIGSDDSAGAGAQFLPSGIYDTDKNLAVCAIIADPSGAANINSVSASVNYPQNIAFGTSTHEKKQGCGAQKSGFGMKKLEKDISIELICNRIRNNNNNLVAWNTNPEYNLPFDYEQICGQDGFLEKQTAAVFCEETALAFNDPAGIYKFEVSALNSGGQTNISTSAFEYLELTTFEPDFAEIQYGPMKKDVLKTLKGDKDWGDPSKPTVRNTGNTRLAIKIWQNDFGLGKTDGMWNITYQAKIGATTTFTSYPPEILTCLNDPLELGETAAADFSALITKFPESSDAPAFWGKMTLSADKLPPLACRQ